MIIENIKTGQRFEVAKDTHFPETAYKIVTPDATAEKNSAIPAPVVVKKPTAKKPASKKKKAKK